MSISRESVQSALESFSRIDVDSGPEVRQAAVCLVIVDVGGGPALVITRRSGRMRAHAGQWALPGGRLDPGETIEEAGLRELSEEVGLQLDADRVLGWLDDYVTRSGYRMTPLVVWAADVPFEPVREDGEVASIHCVPCADLDVDPTFVPIPQSDRPVMQLPLLGTLIHAPTGAIVHQFREVVLQGRATRVAGFEQPVFAWT